jgi:glucokinase
MTVGLDLGGTTFNAACVDNAGRILVSVEHDTRQHDAPDVLVPRLAAAIEEVLSQLDDEQRAEVKAVGIGVPGWVNPPKGVCTFAPNLSGWKNLPVSQLLSDSVQLPVYLVNDADAAALGEARFGAGQGVDDLLVMTLGTGIGSGLILGGKLHLGHSQRGAELGHMTVDVNSKRGTAGIVGTLESVCGRDAIVWRALRYLSSGRSSKIPEICPDLTNLTPRVIAEAAAAGDDIAQSVWNETAHYLAVGIMNVIVLTDLGRVVIGGGVAQAGEVLFAPLRRALVGRTSRFSFDVNEVVPAQLGPTAGVIGAAQWAREFPF